MAKLSLQSTPGINAGENYFARMMPIKDIVVDPSISKIFSIQDRVLPAIVESIKNFGYDKNQPIVLWKDRNIVVDGMTRLTASIEAGLDEILITEKEFSNIEEAMLYTVERQAMRRNLTSSEIYRAILLLPPLPSERNKRGEGRFAEALAKRFGINPSTVYDALDVIKNSSEEDKQAVLDGELSLKKAKARNHPKGEKPDVEFNSGDAQGLPSNVKFLKGAVILLAEADHQEAARLLIEHYLKKNERNGFYGLLPDHVRETLEIGSASQSS